MVNNQLNLVLNRTAFSDSSDAPSAQPLPPVSLASCVSSEVSNEQALIANISNIADETAKMKAACFFLFTKEELISCQMYNGPNLP